MTFQDQDPTTFTLVLGLILSLIVQRLVKQFGRRETIQLKSCQLSQSKAPLRDPFIGLDFLYDRFFGPTVERPLLSAYRMFQQLGPTYVVSRWTSEAIHTSDPRNVKHMLATAFKDFELPKVRVSVMSTLLGLGIFTLDGQTWLHARSILKPSLARKKIEALPAMLEERVQRLLRRIPQSSTGCDLQPLFFSLTMDVATEFLFGRSTKMLEGETPSQKEEEFLGDYMLCSEEAVKKMRLGALSFLRYNSAAEKAKERVFRYIDEYIDVSLRRQENSPEANVLTDLSQVITDRKMLRDQVLHLLLASRDTTASLLSNLFFMLAKQPMIYSKLRGEVVALIGTEVPTFDQLKDLPFLKWCVNESLRLHPVIPSNARQAIRDTVLPYGGGQGGAYPLFVRKGTVVLYNVYTMHRDEKVFGPKTEEFIPERWEKLRPGWGYLPFNGGPRVCMGQQLALLETYYIIARFVQTFESLESRDEREWMELPALAMTCSNGVHVSVNRA